MPQPPLYLLSGLGADERLFLFLRLHHPNPIVIPWILPLLDEPLTSYAKRILSSIEIKAEPPILVGLSFGGMVAQEIAKLIPVRRVILLSSLANTQELPLHYRAGGLLRLQKWLPFQFARYFTAPGEWLFGAKTREEKQIFRSIIRDTDIEYLRWSLTAILQWRHKASNSEIVIIHGSHDKVLPVPKYPNIHLVQGGEHLMVMSRAEEISSIINQYLH